MNFNRLAVAYQKLMPAMKCHIQVADKSNGGLSNRSFHSRFDDETLIMTSAEAFDPKRPYEVCILDCEAELGAWKHGNTALSASECSIERMLSNRSSISDFT